MPLPLKIACSFIRDLHNLMQNKYVWFWMDSYSLLFFFFMIYFLYIFFHLCFLLRSLWSSIEKERNIMYKISALFSPALTTSNNLHMHTLACEHTHTLHAQSLSSMCAVSVHACQKTNKVTLCPKAASIYEAVC